MRGIVDQGGLSVVSPTGRPSYYPHRPKDNTASHLYPAEVMLGGVAKTLAALLLRVFLFAINESELVEV